MSAAAIIPYDNRHSPERERAFKTVLDHLTALSLFPFVATGGDPWSPGRARNFGARALMPDETMIVFNDADSICPPEQIVDAIRMASESPGLVFAYDLYVRKDSEGRNQSPIFNSGSMACVAISRACFQEVGGFDESYVGWGYEDLDFATRCNALWPNRRVNGPVYHLWHGDRNADDSPADSDPAQVAANLERWSARV